MTLALVVLVAPIPGGAQCYEVRLTVPPAKEPTGTLLPGCPSFRTQPSG